MEIAKKKKQKKTPRRERRPCLSNRKPFSTDAEKMEAFGRIGMTLDLVAMVMGVNANSLRQRMNEDAELMTRYQKGWAEKGLELQQTAYNLAPILAKKGNVALLIFILKTKYGFRENPIAAQLPGVPDQEKDSILTALRFLPTEKLRTIKQQIAEAIDLERLGDSTFGEKPGRLHS